MSPFPWHVPALAILLALWMVVQVMLLPFMAELRLPHPSAGVVVQALELELVQEEEEQLLLPAQVQDLTVERQVLCLRASVQLPPSCRSNRLLSIITEW